MNRTRTLPALIALAAAATLIFATAAPAAMMVTTSLQSGAFPVSDSDLVNAGQPTLAGVAASGVTDLAEMNDGDNNDGDGADSEIVPTSSLTFNLDVSVNTLGYDITGITTMFGRTDGNFGGRRNQGYRITLTFVDDSTAVLADGTWEPNSSGSAGFSEVVFAQGGGGVLNNSSFELNGSSQSSGGDANIVATGVKAITFDQFDPANVNDELPGNTKVAAEEFDVFGAATIPEPATLALLGLGGAVMLGGRKRRA